MNNELNAKMAEVMGWQHIGCKYYDDENLLMFNDDSQEINLHEIWNPTEDMNQAMVCWKKAKIKMYVSFDPDDPDVFWVSRYVDEIERRVTTASLEELPLAICSAIKQAVENK